jgi:hypothetical protein
MEEFTTYRESLKQELTSSCSTIALSLDAWTSSNQVGILAVIGHWVTPDFVYKERVLEFAELEGAHSGANMAEVVLNCLLELKIGSKLLTITGDNASNNEALVSELYDKLCERYELREDNSGIGSEPIRFQGLQSYVRCLAHIINLIVKDILTALKSGDVGASSTACDQLGKGSFLQSQSVIARVRYVIQALEI